MHTADKVEIFFEQDSAEGLKSLLGLPDVAEYKRHNYNFSRIMRAETKAGDLAKLNKKYFLGKLKRWESKDKNRKSPFVHIEKHPDYKDGVYLTSHRWTEVEAKGMKTVLEKYPGSDRIEFVKRPGDKDFNPIIEAFLAFKTESSDIANYPLVVYVTEKIRPFAAQWL